MYFGIMNLDLMRLREIKAHRSFKKNQYSDLPHFMIRLSIEPGFLRQVKEILSQFLLHLKEDGLKTLR